MDIAVSLDDDSLESSVFNSSFHLDNKNLHRTTNRYSDKNAIMIGKKGEHDISKRVNDIKLFILPNGSTIKCTSHIKNLLE